jgi:homoserine dehydrogenase
MAVRALFQQSVSAGYPIIAAVRPDTTPDQIEDVYARLRLLLRERGLAV